MKNLLIALLGFGLVGCVTGPSDAYLQSMSSFNLCAKKMSVTGEARYPYIKEELRRGLDCSRVEISNVNDLSTIHPDYAYIVNESSFFKTWLLNDSSRSKMFVDATNPCCKYNVVSGLITQYKKTSQYEFEVMNSRQQSGTTLDSLVDLINTVNDVNSVFSDGETKYMLVNQYQEGNYRRCYYEGGHTTRHAGKSACARYIRR